MVYVTQLQIIMKIQKETSCTVLPPGLNVSEWTRQRVVFCLFSLSDRASALPHATLISQ